MKAAEGGGRKKRETGTRQSNVIRRDGGQTGNGGKRDQDTERHTHEKRWEEKHIERGGGAERHTPRWRDTEKRQKETQRERRRETERQKEWEGERPKERATEQVRATG